MDEMKAPIMFSKSADERTFLMIAKSLSWKKLTLTTECIDFSDVKLPSKLTPRLFAKEVL